VLLNIIFLLLVGRFLLEHSGVDDLTPLPAICSETPGRVNAGAEVLDVPGHGPQLCITRTSSRSSPSCRRVAHFSYHDPVVVFLIWSFSQVAKKLKPSHAHQLGGSGAPCGTSHFSICAMACVWNTKYSPLAPHVKGIYSVW